VTSREAKKTDKSEKKQVVGDLQDLTDKYDMLNEET